MSKIPYKKNKSTGKASVHDDDLQIYIEREPAGSLFEKMYGQTPVQRQISQTLEDLERIHEEMLQISRQIQQAYQELLKLKEKNE